MNTLQKNIRGQQEFRQVCRTHSCPALSALHIEVRRTERLRLEEALAQAEVRSHNRLPAIVHRSNRSDWKITMALSDFLCLCRAPAET